MTLFNDKLTLKLPNADITYYPNFLSDKVALDYFNILNTSVKWQQDNITLFGKTHKQPRLTALYGNNDNSYSYSGITMHPQPFTKTLLNIKQQVDVLASTNFTTCLLNKYRDGNDSNGWHADNEKELGKNPIIASVSLGAKRLFKLKHNNKPIKQDISLEHGSLLIMKGETQHFYKHQIPKTKKQVGARINLTFRVII